jgi:hypothetical protein
MFADMARTQINGFRGVFFESRYFIELFTIFGAPEGIRTPDPQIRSLVLYPAELPALGMSDTS